MEKLRLALVLAMAGCGGGAGAGDGAMNGDLSGGGGPGDFAFSPGDGGGNPGPGPAIAGCPIFPVPPSNAATGLQDEWNRDITGDPVDPMSDTYMASMNAATRKLHPD